MAQNADETVAGARTRPITVGGDEGMSVGGDMPVTWVLGGVGGLLMFLVLVCALLFIIFSLVANQPFTDVLFGTPVAHP